MLGFGFHHGFLFIGGEIKIRLNPCFKREPPQHRLRESVNRFNPNARGMIKQMSKEFAASSDLFLARTLNAHGLDVLGQLAFVDNRPSRQSFKQAVPHFCRRRPGIGHRQNISNRRAVDQQPQNTIGQHPCFACSGIGRYPYRSRRVRGLMLSATRGINDGLAL